MSNFNIGDLSREIMSIIELEKSRSEEIEKNKTDEDRVYDKLKYPPPPKFDPIFMSMIRRLVPATIAKQICDVQPIIMPNKDEE